MYNIKEVADVAASDCKRICIYKRWKQCKSVKFK